VTKGLRAGARGRFGARVLVSRVVGPGESAVAKFADPVAGPGEAVVLVRACGVCASEFPAWHTGDAKGSTLGHEVAGEVIAIGPSVSSVRPGDRVTGLLSDGFAEQTVGRAAELVRLPPGLSFAHPLGEPLGCVMHAIGRLPSLDGMRVAVVGLGFMGLSCLGVLRKYGSTFGVRPGTSIDPATLLLWLSGPAGRKPTSAALVGGVAGS
jgi:D-arabinose 1-dehydrogenase-like Zn-dependent alcohol dehydrogenase